MIYDIAAIPTPYKGTNFRSRLEARWAAFFDLCGWKWDYEPFDLRGWTPDFVLKTPFTDVFVEVKPIDIDDLHSSDKNSELHKAFGKAYAHWSDIQIMLLGMAPSMRPWGKLGFLLDGPPKADKDYGWADIHDYLDPGHNKEELWRQAGNEVQWHR